jgi:WD40 repeat protein
MNLRLQIATRSGYSASFNCPGPAIRIGRDPEGELSLKGETGHAASWNHARIDLAPSGGTLTDVGSSNGTLLNEQRIEANRPVPLRTGDRIGLGHLGAVLTVVELDLTAAADRPSIQITAAASTSVPHRGRLRRTALIVGAAVVGVFVLGAGAWLLTRGSTPPGERTQDAPTPILPAQASTSPSTLPMTGKAQEKSNKPILALDAGGHTAAVWKVLFTPNSKALISISNDKTIRVWDIVTGESRVLRPPIGEGQVGMLYSAALSPKRKTLAVGGIGNPADKLGTIYLISLDTEQIYQTLHGHESLIQALSFSSDEKLLASGSHDNTARIWDLDAGGKCTKVLKGHTNHIYDLAWSPNGQHLATASLDKTARIWSVDTQECEAELRYRRNQGEVRCIAWSPVGDTIATGSDDHSIRLWDLKGNNRKSFIKQGSSITSVTFTADSRQLLVTRGEGKSKDCSLLDLGSGKNVRVFKHANTVLHGTLSPDGTLVATAGGDDNDIYLWKREDDKNVFSHLVGKGRSAWTAAWSPDWSDDRQDIAWGNTKTNKRRLERTFSLWDLEEKGAPAQNMWRAQHQLVRGPILKWDRDQVTVDVIRDHKTVAKLKPAQDRDKVRCFTLLPNDRAVIGTDFGLYLFDTRSGKQIRTFEGHTGSVWDVAPSPNNDYLLTASDDQTLRIWNPDQPHPLVSLFFAGNNWIAWTPEGFYACSPGGEHLMGWHVNNGLDKIASFRPAVQFHQSYYRPDVIKRLLHFGSVQKALEAADKESGKTSVPGSIEPDLLSVVSITSPDKPKVETTEQSFEVKCVAKPIGKHPVTALRLLVNGRPYLGTKGLKPIDPPRQEEVHKSWKVQLNPGINKITAEAEIAGSHAVSDPVTIIRSTARGKLSRIDPRPENERSSMYILAVGVSAYPEKLKLDYAAKDAIDFAEVCKEYGRSVHRDVVVKVLTDKDATRSNILDQLDWLREHVKHNDVAVFFFAGHGGKQNGSFYLFPVEVDPDKLIVTGVPGDQLTREFARIGGRFLVLLDACYSGTLDGAWGWACEPRTRDLSRKEGVIVMCSSMGHQTSGESEGNGYFTRALVESLSGKGQRGTDGRVYLNHLDSYVTDRVKELTNGRQNPVMSNLGIPAFPLTQP